MLYSHGLSFVPAVYSLLAVSELQAGEKPLVSFSTPPSKLRVQHTYTAAYM